MKFTIIRTDRYSDPVTTKEEYHVYLKDKYKPVFYDFEDMPLYQFKSTYSYHNRYTGGYDKDCGCRFDKFLRCVDQWQFSKYFKLNNHKDYDKEIYQNFMLKGGFPTSPDYFKFNIQKFRQMNLSNYDISNEELLNLYLNLVAKYHIYYTPQDFLDNIIILENPLPYAKMWQMEKHDNSYKYEEEYKQAELYQVLEYGPQSKSPVSDMTYDVSLFADEFVYPEVAFIHTHCPYNTLAYVTTFDVMNFSDALTLIKFINKAFNDIKTYRSNGIDKPHAYRLSFIVTKYKPEVFDTQCVSARVRVAIRADSEEEIAAIFSQLHDKKVLWRLLRN